MPYETVLGKFLDLSVGVKIDIAPIEGDPCFKTFTESYWKEDRQSILDSIGRCIDNSLEQATKKSQEK